MTEWMSYLYGQNATLLNNPPSPNGVPVTIIVKDSNDNYRTIGQTTSDSNGFFKLSWTPDITGDYQVYASFAGSDSYWSSNAVTAFNVEETSATPVPNTIQNQSPADMYFVPAVVGIIVAIVVCFAITILLVLRKRQ